MWLHFPLGIILNHLPRIGPNSDLKRHPHGVHEKMFVILPLVQNHNLHSHQKYLWCICWDLYSAVEVTLDILRNQDYEYRQTWWSPRHPSSMDYEDLKTENTKASCVPRSDVVGAQPLRSYGTVGRKARMISLMAWAIEIEMREEPGCETLVVPSQAPWKPEQCQLELRILWMFCTSVSSVPLPSICLFCSLSRSSSLSNVKLVQN